MADKFSLTGRFKFSIPERADVSWLADLTNLVEKLDTVLSGLSNKDYVISGLDVTTSADSLGFTYTGGSVSINSVTVNISSGNSTAVESGYTWVYIQGGVLKVSAYAPTGQRYVPLACLQTNVTGVIGHAEMRPSPPTVNGIVITPSQVNPTSNINMAAGKRVLHADSSVGSNTIMFSNAEVQNVVNWGNQAAAKDWTTINLAAVVPANAKFAILNCYLATLNANADGWAVLEVKTSAGHDNNIYNFVDYGHSSANVLNANQYGNTNQIMLPLSARTFQVRAFVDSLGGTGVYYAFVKLVGYVV